MGRVIHKRQVLRSLPILLGTMKEGLSLESIIILFILFFSSLHDMGGCMMHEGNVLRLVSQFTGCTSDSLSLMSIFTLIITLSYTLRRHSFLPFLLAFPFLTWSEPSGAPSRRFLTSNVPISAGMCRLPPSMSLMLSSPLWASPFRSMIVQ